MTEVRLWFLKLRNHNGRLVVSMTGDLQRSTVCVVAEVEGTRALGELFFDGQSSLLNEALILADNLLDDSLSGILSLETRYGTVLLDSGTFIGLLEPLEHFYVHKRLNLTSDDTETLAVGLLDSIGHLLPVGDLCRPMLDSERCGNTVLCQYVVEELIRDLDYLGLMQERIAHVDSFSKQLLGIRDWGPGFCVHERDDHTLIAAVLREDVDARKFERTMERQNLKTREASQR